MSSETGGHPGGWSGRVASTCGLLAPLCAIGGAGLATSDIATAFVGFRVFLLGLPLAALGILAASVALVRARGDRNPPARRKGLFGLTLSVVTVAAVVGLALPTASFPLINDITTDLDEPPVFVKAATLGPNQGDDMAYPSEFAPQQRAGYPSLGPLELNVTPEDAFERARRALESLPNTRIIDEDAESGRIEALSVSTVFRFVDDIVVRVRPTKHGSIIDVRSRSRDGRGDMGVNANRIEHLFAVLH